MARANEERRREMAEVAIERAHEAWEECDMAEHDRWVAIAERCEEGTQTAEDEAEIAEAEADFAEREAEAERDEAEFWASQK